LASLPVGKQAWVVKPRTRTNSVRGKLANTHDSPCTAWGTWYPAPFVVRGKIINMHYVYILKLNNDKLYTGRTSDLKRRITEHKANKVKSSKYRQPQLIFYEAFSHKDDSIRREKYLKSSKGKSTLKMMLRASLK